jgi:uncharacterized protein YkwD
MASTERHATRTAATFAAVAAVAALCFALIASSSAQDASALGADCGPHVDAVPGEATAREMRKAVRCLINEERAARDRRRVRSNRALTQIAQAHTKVMVADDCFTHQCPGERPLRKRIESSAYLAQGGRYGYGENLGCSKTPQGMVNEWMATSFHRENILDRRFRHVGVGAKRGSPFPRGSEDCMPGRRYMTYTVIFAWRKLKR